MWGTTMLNNHHIYFIVLYVFMIPCSNLNNVKTHTNVPMFFFESSFQPISNPLYFGFFWEWHISSINNEFIQIKHLNFTMIGSHGSRRPMLLRRGKLRIVIVGTPRSWNKLRFENVVAFGPPVIVSVNVSGCYINYLGCYFFCRASEIVHEIGAWSVIIGME